MFTLIRGFKPVFIAMTILSIIMSLPLDYAFAALVPTEPIQTEAASAARTRDHLLTALARQDVRAALIEKGIAPSEAEARIVALTDDEIMRIGNQLGDLPAGADMGMSGAWIAVMVVLMVAIIAAIIILGVWVVDRAAPRQSSPPTPS